MEAQEPDAVAHPPGDEAGALNHKDCYHIRMFTEQTIIAANTVTDIAEHFVGLKTSALVMRESMQAAKSQYTYYTPIQDEQIRHLLVAYWKSRSALFELIEDFLAEDKDYSEHQPGDFLVAYAAVVLLVDAARFMRNQFGNDELLVAKLNEPEPHFDIPAGVYSTVQQSLMNPVNGYHLYRANLFFLEHRESFMALIAGSSPLKPVAEVVSRFGGCMEVAPSKYAAEAIKEQSKRVYKKLAKHPVTKAIYELQRVVSSLIADVYTLPEHRPKLPRPVERKILKLIRPGDVFINRKEYAATNYFLPGYWPHAALYLGDVQEMQNLGLLEHKSVKQRWKQLIEVDVDYGERVLEAQKDGVKIRTLDSPFYSDAISVIRPKLEMKDVVEAIARGMFHEGKAYDFDFDFTRSDRLVCTEVVYRSYDGVGGICFNLTKRAGRLTLSAEDLLRAATEGKGFEVVGIYAPEFKRKFIKGDKAIGVLKDSLGEG